MKSTFFKILALLAITFIFTACPDTTTDPDVEKGYTLSGTVKFKSHISDYVGNSWGDSVFNDATKDIELNLLSGGFEEATVQSNNDLFEFKNLSPGSYQIRAKVNDTILSISENFEMPEYDFNLQDTLFLPMKIDRFRLGIFPNPAVSQTTIVFELETVSDVKMDVIDLSGNQIMNLINEQSMSAGQHMFSLRIDEKFVTGVYYIVLTTGNDFAYCSFYVKGDVN